MDAKKALAAFKEKVDPEIAAYFKRVIEETEKVDKQITESVKYAQKIIMSGGKRARAAFMYYGYLAAGGREKKKIIRTSASIELIHAFLLIHDDVIDRDDLRHGVRTTHNYYADIARNHFKHKDAEHFGNSMAIIVGDMIGALGNQIIFESKFDPALVMKALHKMQGIVSFTVVGESEDIYIENKGKATEKEILRMYENKTAKYTIEGPLQLGAILAGADEKFLQSLSGYAVPAGIAFQIQDDILGVFGQVSKLGKPVGSDVKQGKQTILVAKAFEKGNRQQKETLKKLLGKKDLTGKELEEFKRIIMETGALEYARGMAEKLINQAKKSLDEMRIGEEARKFLIGIADYMVQREA